jgi:phosphoribosyl 1,2-cyclic phosphodiesterase
MTTLYVLGSGSRGNCVAVESGGLAVLVDAGFSPGEIERRAAACGLALERVAGLVLTHEHGDHACGAARLARRLRVPVLTTVGTWGALAPRLRGAEHRPLGLCAAADLGPLRIEACPTSHDAAEPLAVVVRGADGASVGVAYDLGRPTAAVRFLLREVTALVLEANHDEVQLRTSGYPPVVRRRIAGAGGHLSNRGAAELLAELHHPGLGLIVLAHLSQQCNSAADARAAVAPALRRARYRGALHVARQEEPLPALRVAAPPVEQISLGL